eukprot:6184346-Pleurochrysis_carterae.AAC.1
MGHAARRTPAQKQMGIVDLDVHATSISHRRRKYVCVIHIIGEYRVALREICKKTCATTRRFLCVMPMAYGALQPTVCNAYGYAPMCYYRWTQAQTMPWQY